MEQVFQLRMTVSDLEGSTAITQDFEVTLVRFNPCTPGFRQVPTDGTVYQYILQDPAMTIQFVDLDNTECNYDIELFDQATGSPFAHTAFTPS